MMIECSFLEGETLKIWMSFITLTQILYIGLFSIVPQDQFQDEGIPVHSLEGTSLFLGALMELFTMISTVSMFILLKYQSLHASFKLTWLKWWITHYWQMWNSWSTMKPYMPINHCLCTDGQMKDLKRMGFSLNELWTTNLT